MSLTLYSWNWNGQKIYHWVQKLLRGKTGFSDVAVIYGAVSMSAPTWISIGIRRSFAGGVQSRCEGIHPVVDWRQTHQSRSLGQNESYDRWCRVYGTCSSMGFITSRTSDASIYESGKVPGGLQLVQTKNCRWGKHGSESGISLSPHFCHRLGVSSSG